jgi:hypothetical protein
MIDGCAGFAIHRTEEGDFGYNLTALFMALRFYNIKGL